MEAATVVRLRLLDISAVTALVATRVTTGQITQSSVLPAVFVQRVSEVQRSHLRGGESMFMVRVQVSSLAVTRAGLVALDEAVQGDGVGSGLSNWSGTVGSPSVAVRWMQPAGVDETFESGAQARYRIDRDYLVHYRR
jgi:hypothetical protein